jgi:hypothetical protein
MSELFDYMPESSPTEYEDEKEMLRVRGAITNADGLLNMKAVEREWKKMKERLTYYFFAVRVKGRKSGAYKWVKETVIRYRHIKGGVYVAVDRMGGLRLFRRAVLFPSKKERDKAVKEWNSSESGGRVGGR